MNKNIQQKAKQQMFLYNNDYLTVVQMVKNEWQTSALASSKTNNDQLPTGVTVRLNV